MGIAQGTNPNIKKRIIYLAVLGLCCCTGFSLVAESWGYSSCREHASHWGGLPVAEHTRALGCAGFSSCSTGISSCSSWAPEQRLSSCHAQAELPYACGILPDQGYNLCLLHWQVDSLPRSH